jgi:hypothetical protein
MCGIDSPAEDCSLVSQAGFVHGPWLRMCVYALKDACSFGIKKLSSRGGKENINTRWTQERFCNKRANLGETVHFPKLRNKAKSVFPNLYSVEHHVFRGTSYVFREKSWNK